MSLQPCDDTTVYHNLGQGASGTQLLNQQVYSTSNGGNFGGTPIYFSDGTWIYTINNIDNISYITAVESPSDLSCPGSTPSPSSSPIPTGYSLLLGFRTNQTNSCSIGSEPSQRLEMWSNANESSLQNVAISLNPSDDLLTLNYFMYADLYMNTTKNNGYYSDGTYWYRVYGSGRIIDAGTC